jgi:hypothetical protein
VRAGIVEIWRREFARCFAAIDTGEEQGGGGFEYGKRGALKEIGQTDEDAFFAAADRESERLIRIEIDVKSGWAAFAVEARVDALEKRCAAGDGGWEFGHRLGVVYEWGVERSKRRRNLVTERYVSAIAKTAPSNS